MNRRLFTHQQELEIGRQYQEEKVSTYILAKRWGCSVNTIIRTVKRIGGRPRTPEEAANTQCRKELRGERKGKNATNWKGGRYKDSQGYIRIFMPEHPNCDHQGYISEHRLVIEQYMSRHLSSDERVHHINTIRDDNRLENLFVFDRNGDHRTYHKYIKEKHLIGAEEILKRHRHLNTHLPETIFKEEVTI